MESDDYFPGLLLQIDNVDITTHFAAALGSALLLLCFATVLSAAENAISYLSQDDMSKVEESSSARDKAIIYLSGRLRLMKASCSVIYALIIIAVALLCIYGTDLPDLVVCPFNYIIAFVASTALWTIFYGFAPKVMTNHKLGTAQVMSPILRAIVRICAPLIRLTSIPVENPENESVKKKQSPLVNEVPSDMYEEQEMLDEIIHFYNKKSNEIMTPRTDIEAIDIKSSIRDVINVIVKSGYSRIPVYGDNEDNVKGVLFAKDIIPTLNKPDRDDWQSLIRQPFFVPETKKIYDLLNELRVNKTHIAIVVDEFGCMSGLVTMEDIIEEIIGDISDEYDEDEHSFMSLPDGSYIFEGKTQLNDFFRETGVPPFEFSEHTEEAETLTGLLLAIKGTLPHRRDVVDYRNYRFRILEADDRRILKIKFGVIPQKREGKKGK
ncbi:MAG: CBS domain-containing protein [Tannerella sp.]|nr:CBS domain-containing protein [Tannerella sp.]